MCPAEKILSNRNGARARTRSCAALPQIPIDSLSTPASGRAFARPTHTPLLEDPRLMFRSRRHASRRMIALVAATLPAFAASHGTAAAQITYVAQNNLVAIQFESTTTVDDWTLSASTPGFTEDGYFRWDGPNLFNSPGASGIFAFDFEVQTGGNYQLRVRNRHEDPDPTEENDVWIRMDGGQWIKTFSNMAGSVGAWTWESRFDFDHSNQPNANYNLTPGVHRIEFSGRSNGFKMDQFHLFLIGAPGAQNPNTPESPRRFGESYCSANANSTGQVSTITAFGSPELDDNSFTLTCRNLPPNQFGLWITSNQSGFMPNIGGTSANLCINSPGRYPFILDSGASGEATLDPDLTRLPLPTGNVAAQVGSTWHWQVWHRDIGPTANMSRGMRFMIQ